MEHWSTYRKSIRSYQDVPISEQVFDALQRHIDRVEPLFLDEPYEVKVCSCVDEFLPFVKNGLIGKFGFVKGPHYLLLSSHDTPRGKMNLGYIGEQLIKFFTEQNCGTCWLGGPSFQVDTPHGKGFDVTKKLYSIGVVFGTPESGSVSVVEKRTRKKIDQICSSYGDLPQPIQDIVETLVASPTAMNHQGWKLNLQRAHDGTHFFSYNTDGLGVVKRKLVDTMVPLDMGIGLFHLVDRAGEIDTSISFTYEPKGSHVGIVAIG